MGESGGAIAKIMWARYDQIGDHLKENPGALAELREWNPQMHRVIEAFWNDPRGKQFHRALEANKTTARKRLLRAMEALGIGRKPGKAYSDLAELTPGQMKRLKRENPFAHEIISLVRNGFWIRHIAYKLQINPGKVLLHIHKGRRLLGIRKVREGYGRISLQTIARTPKDKLDTKATALMSDPHSGNYHRFPHIDLPASPRARYNILKMEGRTPGILDEVGRMDPRGHRAITLYAMKGRPKTVEKVARLMRIPKTQDAEMLLKRAYALLHIAHYKRRP